MKKFSQLNESEALYALQKEITSYINKVNKRIPQKVMSAIALTQRYGLENQEDLETIKNSTKKDLKKLSVEFNIPEDDLDALRGLLKEIRTSIRLMPQYMTKQEREAFEKGKLSADDMTIDLETREGRNAAAKMYMPVVMAVVNQFVGKSKLDKSDLMSAGLEAMTDAMNTWKKESVDGEKLVSFKTYLGYKVRYAIQLEMSTNGHDLSVTNWGANQSPKDYFLDAVSIDNFSASKDNDIAIDKIAALGVVPEAPKPKEDKVWDKLFKAIEDKFPARDVEIFYSYFALNGREKKKGQDMAKEYGISGASITYTVNRVIKFIKDNPKTSDILDDLRDMFFEGLMYELRDKNRTVIKESLMMNDTYILFEEMFKWEKRSVFTKAHEKACKVADISDILDSFDSIDSQLKIRKRDIVAYLSTMYPGENIGMKNDVELLELLNEIRKAFGKFVLESEETIKSVEDLKELMKAKFEEVFGDKLDKERMEFTIKGFLKSNKKDVEDEKWGELVGKFNQSFVKESLSTRFTNQDAICREYNIHWGTPTDTNMSIDGDKYVIVNVKDWNRMLFSTHIGGYVFKASGFDTLQQFLNAHGLEYMQSGNRVYLSKKTTLGVPTLPITKYTLDGKDRDIQELEVDGNVDNLNTLQEQLNKKMFKWSLVGECLVARIGNKEMVIEARHERLSYPELEQTLLAMGIDAYVIKTPKGYRLDSDNSKWKRVLKTPVNYLPVDFDYIKDTEEQKEMVLHIIKSIS